jgi:hypothetical protein
VLRLMVERIQGHNTFLILIHANNKNIICISCKENIKRIKQFKAFFSLGLA